MEHKRKTRADSSKDLIVEIDNESFEYSTQEKSILECCVRIKHSIEFLGEWMEVIAHPERHPSKSIKPEYISSQLMSSIRVAVRVMDHIIKEIDKTSWCWDKRILKDKSGQKNKDFDGREA